MMRPIWQILFFVLLLAICVLSSTQEVYNTRRLSDLDAWNVASCGLNKTRDPQESKFDVQGFGDKEVERRSIRFAETAEFPWIVLIRIKFESKSISCAGTLIHRDLVVSAAECFNNRELGRAIEISVSAGSNKRPDGSDRVGQTIKVAKVCSSKDYDPAEKSKDYGNNLAVVKLENEFGCDDTINSICLYLPRQDVQFPSSDCRLIEPELLSKVGSTTAGSRLLVAPMKKCAPEREGLDRGIYQDESCYEVEDEISDSLCLDSIGNGLFCRHEKSKFLVLTGILTGKAKCESGVPRLGLFTDLYKLRRTLNEILTICLGLVDDLDF